MMIGFSVFMAVLVADFLSGVGHWFEDSYFKPNTPLIGKIIQWNIEHHMYPRSFVQYPWYITIQTTSPFVLASAVLLHVVGHLSWVSGLTLLIVLFANQVHKSSHMNEKDVPHGRLLTPRAGFSPAPRWLDVHPLVD